MSQRILITGASGLMGSHLRGALEADGHTVLRAVRRAPASNNEVRWDPSRGEIDPTRLEGLDAVVHLAGANIAGKRWTESYKREIRESRVQGTRLISETIARLEPRPRVLVSASAVGYYGSRGDEALTEDSPPGDGFLADVCMAWEDACQAARDAGIRTVNLRTGLVLSAEGGALKSMLLPFKLGVGGIIGNGQQYFSWITLDDAVSAIRFILASDTVSGPINLVSPTPVTNEVFTKTLGKVLRRPTVLPMPAPLARLAFGEMAEGLLLSSARVLPDKLRQLRFEFRLPELEPALRYLLGK